MPLFGGSKRPRLDGLTKEEERRRDALNPEVMRRAGETGVAGQAPAALAILKEKTEAESHDFLWPCLLGWHLMSMRRFSPAIEAFTEAGRRDATDLRGYFGAGRAYFEAAEARLSLGEAAEARLSLGEAAEARLSLGEAAPADVTVADMTVDNMYQQALRNLRRALELAEEKTERDQLREAVSNVDRAVARKAGRL